MLVEDMAGLLLKAGVQQSRRQQRLRSRAGIFCRVARRQVNFF
jgi:hypothetical protein